MGKVGILTVNRTFSKEEIVFSLEKTFWKKTSKNLLSEESRMCVIFPVWAYICISQCMLQNNGLFGIHTEKNSMHEYGHEVCIASHLCIFRLLKKLDDLKKEIDAFWGRHEKRLKQALILRQFEEEFKLVGFPEFTGPNQAYRFCTATSQ